MTNPTPEQVRDGLTADRLAKMRDDALRATDDGRWGAWGMVLVTGPDLDVDNAREIAGFYAVDGDLRTFNLDHVVNFQPKTAVAMIDEVLALRDALTKHRPDMPPRPTGTIPLMGLHDEDPFREAQAQANRTGETVAYRDAYGWVEVEPAVRRGALRRWIRAVWG